MNWLKTSSNVLFHFLVIVIRIQNTFQSCSQSDTGNGYIQCSRPFFFECEDVTERDLVEFLVEKEKKFSCNGNDYCFTLYIKDSVLPTINTTQFSRRDACHFYELTLDKVECRNLILGAREEEFQLKKLIVIDGNFTAIHADTDAFKNFQKLEILNISGNTLRILDGSLFHNIEYIYLENNQIESIAPLTFVKLNDLQVLDLTNNSVSILTPEIVSGLESLEKLILTKNTIQKIPIDTFKDLRLLRKLHLGNNYLKHIQIGVFSQLNVLQDLHLQHNLIEVIDPLTFADLSNLEVLDLTNNKISMVTPETFFGLKKLKVLNLTKNEIHKIPIGTFQHFPFLKYLQLGDNYLKQFQFGTFSNLRNLFYLNVSFNELSNINETVLFPLHNLTILELESTHLSYLNYPLLLTYFPSLRSINLNNNKWNCKLLMEMLNTLIARNVDYNFPSTSLAYNNDNVNGVLCSTSETSHNESFKESIESNCANLSENNVTIVLNKIEGNLFYANKRLYNLYSCLIAAVIALFVIATLVIYRHYFKGCIKFRNNAKDHTKLEVINFD